MGIPFAKTLTKAIGSHLMKFAEQALKGIKDKLDADGDGIKDFDEYPKLLADIKAGGAEALAAIDFEKGAAAGSQIVAGFNALRDAVDVAQLTDSGKKAIAAAQELAKLLSLGVVALAPKGEKK